MICLLAVDGLRQRLTEVLAGQYLRLSAGIRVAVVHATVNIGPECPDGSRAGETMISLVSGSLRRVFNQRRVVVR